MNEVAQARADAINSQYAVDGVNSRVKAANPGRIAQVELLAQMAADGKNFAAVRAKAKELEWGLKDASLRTLYRLAENLAYRRLRTRAAQKYRGARVRLEAVYERAVSAEDLKAQIAVLQEINKLDGLYPDKHQKIDVSHTHKGKVEVSVTAEKMLREIDQYSEEFRLASKAERIERQITVISGEDREMAGEKVTFKERNRQAGNVPVPEENHSDEPVLEDIPDAD